MSVNVIHGDMREVLGRMIAEGKVVQSIVTDPPYGLEFMGKDWDTFKPGFKQPQTGEADGSQFRRNRGTPSYTEAGNPTCKNCGGDKYRNGARKCRCEAPAFGNPSGVQMRAFQRFCTEWAELAFDLLPPGGHLLCFGGTRTFHRLVCAIEEAGFEVRDAICWLYGSGFPKSLNVSKAIDKAGGISPQAQSAILKSRREAAGLSRDAVAAVVGCTPSSVRDWEDGRARSTGANVEWIVPSEEYRGKLADLLGYSKDERILIGLSIDRRDDGTVIGLGHSGELRSGNNTDAARQWNGWGTALKPAMELICVARKPLVGTVAANVLAHGTGALNIDGCRVEGEPWQAHTATGLGSVKFFTEGDKREIEKAPHDLGRWPANVCHDGSDEVVSAFPESGGGFGVRGGDRQSEYGFGAGGVVGYGDAGNAARFFYSSKADADDRLGSKHPTVKPVDLMRWLVRLVTPPGGTVLDPFAGSGTTGMACMAEGIDCILVEREAEYVADIRARIAHVHGDDTPLFSGVMT